MKSQILRVAALLAVLTIVGAACASDNAVTTAADNADATTGDMATGDSADAAMDDMAGHSHELLDWPADQAVPQITLDPEPHDDGSVDVAVTIEGFTLQTGDGSADPDGTGHLHVMIDGRDAGMVFVPSIHLTDLAPGPHTIEIRLATIAHGTYAIDGEALSYSADFVIPGDVVAADSVVTITVDESGAVGGMVETEASLGDLVELRIESSVAEEFHLHVYDVAIDLSPGETATAQFTADIPGIFEAELEGSGVQVLALTVS